MTLAVIGATGETGRKVVERALACGHEVIAVARRPEALTPAEGLIIRQGDARDSEGLTQAIAGADAVISCIGPTSAFMKGNAKKKGVLDMLAANFSPGTIMSEGMPNIVTACQRAGVKRLVMQSGIGLSDGKELAPAYRLLLGVHHCIFSRAIQDKAKGEHAVQQSGLEWVIVRPPGLKDAAATPNYTAGPLAGISPYRPLTFTDCADCLLRAADGEPTWSGKIINVGY